MASTGYAAGTAKAWNRSIGAGECNSLGAMAIYEDKGLKNHFSLSKKSPVSEGEIVEYLFMLDEMMATGLLAAEKKLKRSEQSLKLE